MSPIGNVPFKRRRIPALLRWQVIWTKSPYNWTNRSNRTEFGLYVDKHGDPSRATGTIDWEGKAARVALHHPYILLFDSRFIEVRHVETGHLAQIIPGNDVRCLWDGRGLNTDVATPGPGSVDHPSQEARVHAVMIDPNISADPRPSGVVNQHIFELNLTIPP